MITISGLNQPFAGRSRVKEPKAPGSLGGPDGPKGSGGYAGPRSLGDPRIPGGSV